MDGDTAADVGLADAIATVRHEMELAIAAGQASALAFRAGPIEMEFEVTFSRTGSAEAGVRAWVITGALKGQLERATSHHLKVTLFPVRRDDGTDQIIGDVGGR
jgi:hypothetical protein